MKRQKCDKFSKKEGDNGFTLIEVLITIVILSVGLLGMASLTVGIIKGNAFSNHASTATTLAQDKMEEIWEQDYSDVVAEAKANLTSTFSNYEREVEVDLTIDPDTDLLGMKIVTVTVSWTDQNGGHEVKQKTILSRSK